MLTIGITGSIGSGKSTVADILRQKDIPVLDADRVAWKVYRAGLAGFDRVVSEFGYGVVGRDGEVDRKKLGALVFSDSAKLERLTDIVWPLMKEEIKRWKLEIASHGNAIAALEAAVLFEAGWEDLCDEVWVVTAPRETILRRVAARDGATREEIEKRVGSQTNERAMSTRANVVVENDKDHDALKRVVEAVVLERTEGKA